MFQAIAAYYSLRKKHNKIRNEKHYKIKNKIFINWMNDVKYKQMYKKSNEFKIRYKVKKAFQVLKLNRLRKHKMRQKKMVAAEHNE